MIFNIEKLPRWKIGKKIESQKTAKISIPQNPHYYTINSLIKQDYHWQA